MDFEQEFENWLSSEFKYKIPSDVKAFSFNLFEPSGVKDVKFGIEIIGSSEFNKDDEDWACHEIWEPEIRQLDIPIEYSGENWEECLEVMKKLTSSILASNKPFVKKLKNSQGIGIGFVDGNLAIIWQP